MGGNPKTGDPEEKETGPRLDHNSRSDSRLQFILTRVSSILHKVRVILVYSVEHMRRTGWTGTLGREKTDGKVLLLISRHTKKT